MSGCVETPYFRNSGGYGRLKRNDKLVLHHRVVYTETNKVTLASIEGLVVRHTCDNPSCINPEHLVLGTHQDNINDKVIRRRGKYRRAPQLSAQQVHQIRTCSTPDQRKLGKEYGVSQSTVSRVIRKEGSYDRDTKDIK